MALQSGQWALVHLNLLDKQLTMEQRQHPLKNGNKMLINTFAF
jgi:hypothetical protein